MFAQGFLKRITKKIFDREDGDHYSFLKIGRLRSYQTNDPALIQDAFADARSRNFLDVRFVTNTLRKLIGRALSTDYGASWQHMRKLFTGPFSKSKIQSTVVPIMTQEVETMLRKWNQMRSGINVGHDFQVATGNIITRYLLGHEFRNESNTLVQLAGDALRQLEDRGQNDSKAASPYNLGVFQRSVVAKVLGISHGLTGKIPADLMTSTKQAGEILDDIINKRRRLKEQPDDILGLLINSKDAQGKPLTNQHITDQIIAFIIAGHESTSNTLTFAFDEVSKRPELQKRLAEEFAMISQGQKLDGDMIGKLTFAGHVFNEATRCYPAVASTSREIGTHFVWNDFNFQPHDLLKLNIQQAHQRTDIWGDDALDFQPERFEKKQCPFHTLKGTMPRILSFGFGPRTCIGKPMAESSGAGFLSLAHGVFNIKAEENLSGLDSYFVLRPRGDLIISVDPRPTYDLYFEV